MNIAILIFDGAEELDFVGPWEVFTTAAQVVSARGGAPPRAYLVSESGGAVRCAKGMRVETDHSFATAPQADVILVPGGQGTRREVSNPTVLSWIADQAAKAKWVTSVCTGSLLLVAAGPAQGRRIRTHWRTVEEIGERLKVLGRAATVVTGDRWVVDSSLVTAGGVSAGIDMTLWLVGQIYGADVGSAVTKAIEYDPAPPFAFA